MQYFGSITLELFTDRPCETDEEIEARCVEFGEFRDRVEQLILHGANFVPAGWHAAIEED